MLVIDIRFYNMKVTKATVKLLTGLCSRTFMKAKCGQFLMLNLKYWRSACTFCKNTTNINLVVSKKNRQLQFNFQQTSFFVSALFMLFCCDSTIKLWRVYLVYFFNLIKWLLSVQRFFCGWSRLQVPSFGYYIGVLDKKLIGTQICNFFVNPLLENFCWQTLSNLFIL